MTRLSLICSALVLVFTGQIHADEISSGFEAQVRLPSGETFVSIFESQPSTTATPYLPATPYGYVGYKLPSGLSLGLGLGFAYYNLNNNVPTTLVANNGWALMVAPTIQAPFIRGDHYEFFGVARFILGAGRIYSQVPANPVFVSTPEMSYGGNLGIGGTWYPIGCFGIGAEVGAAANYLDAKVTVTTAGTPSTEYAVNATYVQTYFALTSSFIF